MIEAEASAELLLMTGTFRSPQTIDEPIEQSIVRAVLAGENDRFGRLYEMYAPLVHGVLLARVPRDQVDDLVQDIFLHALRKLHTLRNPLAFGPWIAMIARNRAMDFHRASRGSLPAMVGSRAGGSCIYYARGRSICHKSHPALEEKQYLC